MKLTQLIVLLSLPLGAFSQVSMDSLWTAIQKNYCETGTRDYLMKEFIIYKSTDGKDRYDVYLDSTNNLAEYIGLCMVHYQLDDAKRTTLIEGFGKDGGLSYWDFPPKQVFTYETSPIKNLKAAQSEVCNCEANDSSGYIRKIVEFNDENKPTAIRFVEISSDSTTFLKYGYRPTGKLITYSNSVYYTYWEFKADPDYWITLEAFFNDQLKLQNGDHSIRKASTYGTSSKTDHAYTVREVDNGKISKLHYYDANRELILTDDISSNGKPIINGVIIKSRQD